MTDPAELIASAKRLLSAVDADIFTDAPECEDAVERVYEAINDLRERIEQIENAQ